MNDSATDFDAAVAARAAVLKDFAKSELFERTFQEGMELVEETAGLSGRRRAARKASCCRGRGPVLRGREHEADHAADADRLLAAGAARGA
jgi:hypothetical protein